MVDNCDHDCSGVTGEGAGWAECHPRDFWPGNLCWRRPIADVSGKERQGKQGKWSRKKGKSKQGRVKIENGRRKSYKKRWVPFFFFFFAFHFSKRLKFVLGLPKWEFPTRKKDQEKCLCPLRKICLLRPCMIVHGTKFDFLLKEHHIIHCKYQRYILTRCSVNLLVVFNTMVLKRVFFVIINTCVAVIWALMC